MIAFLDDFLSDRSFDVLILTNKSSTKILANGVPQGAIFSPTLFLISFESLLHSLPPSFTPLVYADDIVLISSNADNGVERYNVQQRLNILWEWPKNIGYDIAAEKSNILQICNKPHHLA